MNFFPSFGLPNGSNYFQSWQQHLMNHLENRIFYVILIASNQAMLRLFGTKKSRKANKMVGKDSGRHNQQTNNGCKPSGGSKHFGTTEQSPGPVQTFHFASEICTMVSTCVTSFEQPVRKK